MGVAGASDSPEPRSCSRGAFHPAGAGEGGRHLGQLACIPKGEVLVSVYVQPGKPRQEGEVRLPRVEPIQ